MKVCVFGAGAIGGFIAAKLALSGHNVTLIARGKNLNAIKQNGLKIFYNNFEEIAFLEVSDKIPTKKQDFVFLATKTTSLVDICPKVQKLCSTNLIIQLKN